MKKFLFLMVCLMLNAVSPVSGIEAADRKAAVVDKNDTAWEITNPFIFTEPGGFYESRFCLTIQTGTFRVAIPTENLITVEVNGEHCTAAYEWMGRRHKIEGKLLSKLVGGRGNPVDVTLEFRNVKRLIFNNSSAVALHSEAMIPDATLVLKDGKEVPVANLLRVSSQDYPAVPSAGVPEGTVFERHNDLGFLKGKSAPTFGYEDLESMAFPTPNTLVLTFRETPDTTAKTKGEVMNARNKKVSPKDGEDDADFLLKAVEDLARKKDVHGIGHPKNRAYGFTGIFQKGYFFIDGAQVKSIRLGTVTP